MSDVIPDFETMSIAEIKQWMSLNSNDAEASKQASAVLEKQSSETTADDEYIVDEAGEPSLVPPAGNLDFCGAIDVFRHVEELLHIFEQGAASTQHASRATINAFIEQGSEYSPGADEPEASQVVTAALAALVMSVTRTTFSLLAFSGHTDEHDATHGLDEQKRDKIKAGVQAALREISYVQEAEIQGDEVSPQVRKRLVDAIFQAIDVLDLLHSESMSTANFELGGAASCGHEQSDKVFQQTVQKMKRLLRTFYDAQTKAEEAVSQA